MVHLDWAKKFFDGHGKRNGVWQNEEAALGRVDFFHEGAVLGPLWWPRCLLPDEMLENIKVNNSTYLDGSQARPVFVGEEVAALLWKYL